jgi:hypothetical protein
MHKDWQGGIARLPRAAFLAPHLLVDFWHHAVLRGWLISCPKSMEVLTRSKVSGARKRACLDPEPDSGSVSQSQCSILLIAERKIR